MTPILPMVMLGIAIILLCMEIINGYLTLTVISRQKAAVRAEPPKARRGHVDLEETKLEPKKNKK